MEKEIIINSRDYWFKVVDMLQQNWALIETEDNNKIKVFFIGDTSGVFDELLFDSKTDAERSLSKNGFKKLVDDKEAKEFISPPSPPFHRLEHPNGKIYSSGIFWK